jgi:nitrate/nitrite-specific signal transduction histidine kinase
MNLIYFLTGLAFEGLGLAAYLQLRQGRDLPLSKHLKWLASFGFVYGITNWLDMFLASGGTEQYLHSLSIMRLIAQPLTGLLLLRFGWGLMRDLPLPAWTIFIPGVMIVPIAYVITYAATTFITPSPVEIPVDIWSRYLLYLPGAILAGIGYLRQWNMQRKLGNQDITTLMLGAGVAFLIEAFIVGLVVPAAPYGPASYYNYNRTVFTAFTGEQTGVAGFFGFTSWLDYMQILKVTGLPVSFWRMISAFTVTFLVMRGLGVFEAMRARQLKELQDENARAQKAGFDAQIIARQSAEKWTESLVSINRRITELEDVDSILLYIVENARKMLRADFVGLALLTQPPSHLELKYFSDENRVEMVRKPVKINTPLLLETLLNEHTYRSTDCETPARLENILYDLGKPVSGAGIVRLELDAKPVGVLWAARSDDQLLSETDLIWLECMADQVVIAIQHGLMMSQLQSLSITEERARIAREMHDGLAQVLGYLNLQVQTLEALHKQGKNETLELELGKMREAIKVAHADVRENILSLRTTLSSEKGLASAISEYMDEFSIQTGIETELDLAQDSELNLSSVAEVQLVCILQEALTNVRKHANSSQVKVMIRQINQKGQELIQMQVSDNGIGFKLRDSKHRFGLKTMKERAISARGTLEVRSVLGKGTTVDCSFPCIEPEPIKNGGAIFSLEGKNLHFMI